MRKITVPAGTRRYIQFSTTYSSDWSVAEKQGQNIEDAEVSSAKFMLKKRATEADDDAALTKTKVDGITVTSGKVTVLLNPNDTKDLDGDYIATLRLYLSDDAVVDWTDTSYENTPYIQIEFVQGAVEAVS